MDEKQLVKKIRQLQEIKPRKEWAILAKSQIFAEAVSENKAIKLPDKTIGILDILSSFIFQRKLAYSFAALVFVIAGVFGFAQSTLPGDALFPVRKIAEQSQAAIIGVNSLQSNLEIYDKRVQDLMAAVKSDKKSNIPSAISEVKQSMSEAVKSIADAVKQEDGRSIKDIIADVKKIEDSQKQLQTLGVDMGGAESLDELSNVLSPLVKSEIENLEKATLTDEQQDTLVKIKELYSQKEYSQALEKILLINE